MESATNALDTEYPYTTHTVNASGNWIKTQAFAVQGARNMLAIPFDDIGFYIETYCLPALPDPPRLWVFMGANAYQYSAYWQRSGLFIITLDPWLEPLDYKWPVSGSDVAIFDFAPKNQALTDDLIGCLLLAQAQQVIYFNTLDHTLIKAIRN